MKIIIGATKNRTLSTWLGVNSALKRNFTPSASGWPSPNRRIFVSGIPTRFGPSRSCTHAAIQRSKSTRYAAAVISPPISRAIFSSGSRIA